MVIENFSLEKKKSRIIYYLFHFALGLIVSAFILIGWTSYILGDNLIFTILGLVLVAVVIMLSNFFVLKNSTSRGKYLVTGMLIMFLTVAIELGVIFFFISRAA